MIAGSIRIAMTSDRGLKRRNNQDAGFAQQGVYMVCDGMGGGFGGERASQLAIRQLSLLANLPTRHRQDISETLAAAQQHILALGKQLGGVAGTTICGLVLPARPLSGANYPSGAEHSPNTDCDMVEMPVAYMPAPAADAQTTDIDDSTLDSSRSHDLGQTYIINIGDSRTYHMNPCSADSPSESAMAQHSPNTQNTGHTSNVAMWDAASLTRITHDHSQRQEAIDSGLMTPEVAEALVPRNIITQCLGDPDGIAPDIYVADMSGRFIICSDGLYGEVPDHRIASITAAHASPRAAVDALVAAALDAGGTDNITVIVVDMPDSKMPTHEFNAFRLGAGEDLGIIEDTTLQTLRTIHAIQP